MMYRKYLWRKLPLFLIFGTACAVLAGANIAVYRSNRDVQAILDRVGVLDTRNGQIQRDSDALQARLAEVKENVPARFAKLDDQEMLLWGVDELKRQLPGAALAFTDIARGATESKLAMDLTLDYTSYPLLLKQLDYLERSSFPFFRVRSVTITKELPTKVVCKISGELTTPGKGGRDR
jgi:hypothetical protein